MSEFSIQTPNGPVSGRDSGSGPAVLLVAGLGSTGRIWGHLPEVLSRDLRVLVVDNRGVGGSRTGGPFTLGAAAEDLRAVLDARGVERTAILGASMGGVIALRSALAIPGRVSRLVVASTSARLTSHGRRMLELLRDLLLYAPPERAGAALMTLAFAPQFHERHAGFVDEACRLYGPDEADVPGTLVQLEHLLEGWDLRHDLPGLGQPVLALCGDRDPVVAPDETAEIVRLLPRAELVRVPGAAHSVLAEGGDAVLRQVKDFLTTEHDDPAIV